MLKISLIGRLDAETSEDLRRELDGISENYSEAVFDFGQLEYISSAGLRQLLTVRKHLSSNNDLRVINCSDPVLEVFSATVFDTMMVVTGAEDTGSMQDFSFKELLEKQAERRGDSVFLDDGTAYTWREIEQAAQILAFDMRKAGVKRNSHVGICSANSVNWLIAFFAIQKLGGIAILLNFNLSYAEITELTKLGDITHICFGETTALPPYEELTASMAEDENSFARSFFDIRTAVHFKERLAEYDIVEGLFVQKVNSDDACIMIFSSGTTGKPKGVLLSAYNVLTSAQGMADVMGVTEEDSACLVPPMFHIFGLMVGVMVNALRNAKIVIPENLHTRTIINVISEKSAPCFTPFLR